MSRRPDRLLERRIARNWFPYDLLNVSYAEDGRLSVDAVSKCTSIAIRQANTIPLAAVSTLEPEVLVWVAMMFELILDKFWRQDYRAPALSYTGEMIRQEAALLTAARDSGLPVPIYEKIGLTPISVSRIKGNAQSVRDALGSCPDNPNQWMLDRYGDRCSDESLNLLAMPSDVFLLDSAMAVKTVTTTELAARGELERKVLRDSGVRLHQLRATAVGTKAELDNDRIWLARHNLATQVQAAASVEYAERKQEISDWFERRIRENLPNLLKCVGHEQLFRRVALPVGGDIDVPCGPFKVIGDPHRYALVKVMSTISRDEYNLERRYGFMATSWWQGRAIPRKTLDGEPLCAFTGARISYVTTFSPVTAEDLAWLAGCTVAELPEVLQHFQGVSGYTGNSILDRIDPAVTQLRNPWLKLNFRVRIGLSLRGRKRAMAEKDRSACSAYLLGTETAPAGGL